MSPAEPIRVLVVEDDPVAADAHVLYVGRVPGFVAVGQAGTGAAARRVLDRTPVDLLLLDLHLPDVHGLQLARSLRAAGHQADVIAVTSARDLAVVREGVSLGVVQYVLKPFTFATLRDRLLRYAEYHAAAGEASGQDEVDRALAALRAPAPAALPKGLSAPTLERVTGVLRRHRRGPDGGGAWRKRWASPASRPAATWSTWWTRPARRDARSTARWAGLSCGITGCGSGERSPYPNGD